MLEELTALIATRNESLSTEVNSITTVLTPVQIAKFILWVERNPACMLMLDQLWKLHQAHPIIRSRARTSSSTHGSSDASAGAAGAGPATQDGTAFDSQGRKLAFVPGTEVHL